MRIALALSSVLLAFPLAASGATQDREMVDRVLLKSGRDLEGRVLFENEEFLIVDTGHKEQRVPQSDVAEVESVERSLVKFLERFDAIDVGNPEQLLELARFAEEHELPGEARNLHLRVLGVDPTNEVAWKSLGGKMSKRLGWRLRVRGRYLTLDALRERVSDWRNALELTTAHFFIRTDIAPERALDLAINIERAYLEFYSLFGTTLELFVFSELPSIYVYASEEEFPTPTVDGKNAWYTEEDNILYVNGGGDGKEVAREAMRHFIDMMMFTSFKRTMGDDGMPAPFVSRGVGLLFGAALEFDRSFAEWKFESPSEALFQLHANAEEVRTIKEILNASEGDYASGGNAPLTVAQTYTLMYFLVFGENGRYRDSLSRFVASSFTGRSSSSHFEEILGIKIEDLEPSYTAFVKQVASGT